MGRKSVAGSLIGGAEQEMLRFLWRTQYSFGIIKMQDINTAYDRYLKSDVNTVLL
jgi:D-arabinose 1-dehydrogenase-like Zn-dependent alcohol dehydrogenase